MNALSEGYVHSPATASSYPIFVVAVVVEVVAVEGVDDAEADVNGVVFFPSVQPIWMVLDLLATVLPDACAAAKEIPR